MKHERQSIARTGQLKDRTMAVAREGQKHGMNKARADTDLDSNKDSNKRNAKPGQQHKRTNKDKGNHRTSK